MKVELCEGMLMERPGDPEIELQRSRHRGSWQNSALSRRGRADSEQFGVAPTETWPNPRLIASMNARRIEHGKPPLSEEQEKSMRETR
jgi:hypothetical protein